MEKYISINKALALKDLSAYPFMNLSLDDMPGEEWVEIPQFDGYYLVSNYGRIWARPRPVETIDGKQFYYTKERIRKQGVFGFYNETAGDYVFQLQANLRYERSHYHFLTNRLVYQMFIGPLNYKEDNLRVVHKDGDNFNNNVNNLAVSNGSELIYKSFRANRRSRFPRGNRLNNGNTEFVKRIAVVQYSLAGKKLKTYPSVKEAAAAIGTDRAALRLVMTKRRVQAKGFVFRYKGDPYNGEHGGFSKVKKVSQFAPGGKLVKQYISVAVASAQTGIDVNTISKCALRKSKFGSGFVWRYTGDTYNGEYSLRTAKIVVQYTKEGKMLNKYPSINTAAKAVGISSSSLRDCLTGKSKFSANFVWRYEGQPYNGEYRHLRTGKPVLQFNLAGKKLGAFITIEAAAKATGLTAANIQKNVSGANYTAGGFVWRFATEKESKLIPDYEFAKGNYLASNAIAVNQYHKNGRKIASFSNMSAAARVTGATTGGISKSIKSKYLLAGGFVWRRKGESYKGELADTRKKNEAREVTQYSLEGKKIKVYSSIHEAGRAMKPIGSTSINQVVNGKLLSAHGFLWRCGNGPVKIEVSDYHSKKTAYSKSVSKPVSCYDLTGRKTGFFKSMNDAAKRNNIALSRINAVISGKLKSTQEMIWILGDGPRKIDVNVHFT